jgi:two-component sensor histidine kinase
MAKVHTLLQEVKNPSQTLLPPHLSTIARSLINELRPDLSYQEFLPGHPVTVPPSIAMTCGLLVHELIMNSIRHAFPSGRQGTITLCLSNPAAGLVRLAVEDNGVGMPKGQPPGKPSSLGLMIVSALCADLGGTLTYPPQGSGTKTLIDFPHPHEQESP